MVNAILYNIAVFYTFIANKYNFYRYELKHVAFIITMLKSL